MHLCLHLSVFLCWVTSFVSLLRFSQVPLPSLLDDTTPHLHFHTWMRYHTEGTLAFLAAQRGCMRCLGRKCVRGVSLSRAEHLLLSLSRDSLEMRFLLEALPGKFVCWVNTPAGQPTLSLLSTLGVAASALRHRPSNPPSPPHLPLHHLHCPGLAPPQYIRSHLILASGSAF